MSAGSVVEKALWGESSRGLKKIKKACDFLRSDHVTGKITLTISPALLELVP